MIVSDGFLIEVLLIGLMCYSVRCFLLLLSPYLYFYRGVYFDSLVLFFQLYQVGESFVDDLLNWDVTLAAAGIGIFLLRYMTIGLQIDKKFKNLSILITEQVRYSR